MADWRLGLHAEMSLLLDMSFHTRSSFLCATETESMATVCLSPHSPASGGRLHAFDRRCAQHQHEERLVWRALQMHMSGQGWVMHGWG